ncbi:PorT family protein [candidate division KSB1 bacterium]|nr:PorT family protein [candidate division KSB1 bacterium]
MKKLSLLLVLQCVAAGLVMPASAQVRLGVIGGLNLANLRFDPGPVPGISKTTAFGAGGVMQLRLAENLALQLEPMYLQKGAKLESSFFDFGFDSSQAFSMNVKFKLNYLEVPAMLKLDIGTGTTKTYVMAGPIIGFRMSAKLTGSISDAGINQKIDEDIKGQTKSLDFGVGFGAGVSFPAGGNAIFVQGRYTLGLIDINDDPEDPETKIKTSGIQVMTGIIFPIGQ